MLIGVPWAEGIWDKPKLDIYIYNMKCVENKGKISI